MQPYFSLFLITSLTQLAVFDAWVSGSVYLHFFEREEVKKAGDTSSAVDKNRKIPEIFDKKGQSRPIK